MTWSRSPKPPSRRRFFFVSKTFRKEADGTISSQSMTMNSGRNKTKQEQRAEPKIKYTYHICKLCHKQWRTVATGPDTTHDCNAKFEEKAA